MFPHLSVGVEKGAETAHPGLDVVSYDQEEILCDLRRGCGEIDCFSMFPLSIATTSCYHVKYPVV